MSKKQTLQRIRTGFSIGFKVLLVAALVAAVIAMSTAQQQSEALEAEPPTSPLSEKEPAYGESVFLTAAENDRYALLYNPATGEVAVECLDTGKIWYSNPQDRAEDELTTQPARLASQLVMSSYVVNTQQKQTKDNYAASINKGGMECELVENGVKFSFAFPDQGIVIPVRYTIDGEGLSVEIRASEIQELFTERYVLASVSVLPFFGAGGLADDGYLFVPDGSGALIDFNNGKESASAYSANIYGDDTAISRAYLTTVTESVRLPVFGIKNGDYALLAVVEEGDASGKISASVSRKGNSYNYVYSEMVFRRSEINAGGGELGSFSTMKFMDCYTADDVYRVRYFFLDGGDADYSGMARRYRSYLEERGELKASALAAENPFVLDLYGAVPVEQVSMGITSDRTTALTTYRDALGLTEALGARGVESLVVNYQGAYKGGLDNVMPASAAAERTLGSSKDYAALISTLAERNIPLFIDTDFFSFHNDGSGFSTARDSVRSVYDSPVFQYEYGINTFVPIPETRYWLLKPTLVPGLAEKFFASAGKLGIANLGFTVAADAPYSDFAPESAVTRTEAIDSICSILQTADERFDSVLVHAGNAYALGYADLVLDSPMDSSHYDMTDRAVPFYQIVTRGSVVNAIPSVNLSSNRRASFLKALESGSSLCFTWIGEDVSVLEDTDYNYLFGADPSLWLDIAAEQYDEYRGVMDKIGSDRIESHRYVTEEVTETVYGSGSRIVINYSNSAYLFEGTEIPSMGYVFLPA